MPHVTFLSPATISALTAECKAFLEGLSVEIIEEDLTPTTTGSNTIFKSRFRNWLVNPVSRIRKIDTDSVETLLFEGTDYTLDLASGTVTLTATTTDTIRADYFFQPLSDAILEQLLGIAVKEVEVLIHRPIDDSNILRDYQAPVCKRLYTNVVKTLTLEARNFFAIGVGDRIISKEQIPGHLQGMWQANEIDLMKEITQLRDWNQTKRFE